MKSNNSDRTVGFAGGVKFESTADAANPTSDFLLKDDEMSPVIQAILADIVIRFRQDWITISRMYFRLLESVRKDSGENLSKHITATLIDGMTDFGQFLCQFEVFFLEIQERRILLEYGRLSPYECFLKLRDFCRDESGISDVRKSFNPSRNDVEAS